MLYFFQQDDLAQSAIQAEPVVEEKTLSLFDLMMSGGLGGQLIIGILFILLFVAMYIYGSAFSLSALEGSSFLSSSTSFSAEGSDFFSSFLFEAVFGLPCALPLLLASAIPVRRRPRRLVRISWIATTAEALAATADWAGRASEAGSLSEVDELVLRIGFGEYCAQIAGGRRSKTRTRSPRAATTPSRSMVTACGSSDS